MNVKITRPSDSPFKCGDVVSEGTYAEMVYLIWDQGGEIPLGAPTVAPRTPTSEDVQKWLENGYDMGVLKNR